MAGARAPELITVRIRAFPLDGASLRRALLPYATYLSGLWRVNGPIGLARSASRSFELRQ
jgi:hypothetical protein